MILAILQARVSSTRLPGKVLAPVLGEPMIARQLERVSQSSLIDQIVVATSTDPSDDELVSQLEPLGYTLRRGPLHDVVARFESVVEEFDPETIVRLTADCPLCDVGVIDAVIGTHLAEGSDYTSNTLEPTFPDGLDVEVVSAEAWRRLSAMQLTSREREHVTLGLYNRPSDFALESVTQPEDHSGLRWTVDVPADLEFVRTVYESLYPTNPKFSSRDVLRLIADRPELNRTAEALARNAALQPE